MVVDEKWQEQFDSYEANNTFRKPDNDYTQPYRDDLFNRQLAKLSNLNEKQDYVIANELNNAHMPQQMMTLPARRSTGKGNDGLFDLLLDTVMHFAWLPFLPVQRFISKYRVLINTVFALAGGATAAVYLIQQLYPYYAVVPLVIVAAAIGVNIVQIVYWILEFIAAIIAVSVLLSGLFGLVYMLYLLAGAITTS